MLYDFKNETELECAEEIQKCVSRQTAAVIHRLANSVGVSCRAMNRSTSVRMDTLTNHNPNPCQHADQDSGLSAAYRTARHASARTM